MKVHKENLSGIVVLTLKGEFDSFVTKAFGNQIDKIQEEGVQRIVLNMRLVQFINSTGLGAMIRARRNCRSKKGDVVVADPSDQVVEAMESLGLDRLFSIYDDDEAALSALQGGGGIAMEGDSESAVMIHTAETTRPQIARLTRLDSEGLSCRLGGAPGKLVEGRTVHLKFRLPLYRRTFFEIDAKVEKIDETARGYVLALHFTKISPEDRDAIESFVSDLAELRKAARGGD